MARSNQRRRVRSHCSMRGQGFGHQHRPDHGQVGAAQVRRDRLGQDGAEIQHGLGVEQVGEEAGHVGAPSAQGGGTRLGHVALGAQALDAQPHQVERAGDGQGARQARQGGQHQGQAQQADQGVDADGAGDPRRRPQAGAPARDDGQAGDDGEVGAGRDQGHGVDRHDEQQGVQKHGDPQGRAGWAEDDCRANTGPAHRASTRAARDGAMRAARRRLRLRARRSGVSAGPACRRIWACSSRSAGPAAAAPGRSPAHRS